MPVWHLHESLERLQRLARCWRTVALGSSGQWSSPGTGVWWKRMGIARCWKRLSSSPVEERSIRPADVRPAQAMGSYTESVEYPSSPAIQLSSHLCDNMQYVWHEPRLHFPAARPSCADAALDLCALDQPKLGLERIGRAPDWSQIGPSSNKRTLSY